MTMYLNSTSDINTMVGLANSTQNLVNPEIFYSKQLLDTIRMDSEEYKYYKLADESPIQNKANKLTVRRWAPLQAHTVPLTEGVPPTSDKGSVEKYEITAHQYGRYMEFTDKVDFAVVDPVIAHYSREYSLVALETLDLLARETLLSVANKHYAGSAAGFENLTATSKPTLTDLRVIGLSLKRKLVKPRKNGRFVVICSPEFTYDLVTDPTVEKYMTVNQTTKNVYDGSVLFPLFGFEFEESLCVPASGEFYKDVSGTSTLHLRLVRDNSGTPEYYSIPKTQTVTRNSASANLYSESSGYVKDSRTTKDASYMMYGTDGGVWDVRTTDTIDGKTGWQEFKAHHIIIVGKEALTRTGLTGEGGTRMYVKQKGSAGVLDPIDQRQSIGFKINSVGFGSTRTEAIVDYICVPSMANLL